MKKTLMLAMVVFYVLTLTPVFGQTGPSLSVFAGVDTEAWRPDGSSDFEIREGLTIGAQGEYPFADWKTRGHFDLIADGRYTVWNDGKPDFSGKVGTELVRGLSKRTWLNASLFYERQDWRESRGVGEVDAEGDEPWSGRPEISHRDDWWETEEWLTAQVGLNHYFSRYHRGGMQVESGWDPGGGDSYNLISADWAMQTNATTTISASAWWRQEQELDSDWTEIGASARYNRGGLWGMPKLGFRLEAEAWEMISSPSREGEIEIRGSAYITYQVF